MHILIILERLCRAGETRLEKLKGAGRDNQLLGSSVIKPETDSTLRGSNQAFRLWAEYSQPWSDDAPDWVSNDR